MRSKKNATEVAASCSPDEFTSIVSPHYSQAPRWTTPELRRAVAHGTRFNEAQVFSISVYRNTVPHMCPKKKNPLGLICRVFRQHLLCNTAPQSFRCDTNFPEAKAEAAHTAEVCSAGRPFRDVLNDAVHILVLETPSGK